MTHISPDKSLKKEIGVFDSPIGSIEVKAITYGEEEDKTDAKSYITSVIFSESPETATDSQSSTLQNAIKELQAYFAGNLKEFTFSFYQEGTHFQQAVWKELVKIPFGKVISYQELANRMGDVKKIRAVGKANGLNQLAIVVPCHRVIGKNNDLIGYAGGLWRKEWLLEHEGVLPKRLF